MHSDRCRHTVDGALSDRDWILHFEYPFWQMTNDNKNAVYACLNYNEALCPKQIERQCICIAGDAGAILEKLKYGHAVIPCAPFGSAPWENR